MVEQFQEHDVVAVVRIATAAEPFPPYQTNLLLLQDLLPHDVPASVNVGESLGLAAF